MMLLWNFSYIRRCWTIPTPVNFVFNSLYEQNFILIWKYSKNQLRFSVDKLSSVHLQNLRDPNLILPHASECGNVH